MAIINQGFVDGAVAAARAVQVHARQAATSITTSTISAAISSASSATQLPSLTSTPSFAPSSTIDPSPSPTTVNPGSSQNNSGGQNTGGSSPLLFFVALGFGVVFTNLWIIVGVKYCFRYNARNRQLRGLDENGEPINLENMPTRPHRRRREKKLMTMDEVNEKFPMMKYKTWVAGRLKEGLPTTGGVSVSPSRANSIRSVTGIVPETVAEVPSKEEESTEDSPTTAAPSNSAPNPDSTPGSAESGAALTKTPTIGSIVTKDPDHAHTSDDEEDEDEQINAALPPELLATSGDTCAICIDTLEDDDDVRGLTCGHAFHAVCLDPWLTNRRACCPLCKADYYTPKPRPPPVDGDATATAANTSDPARNNARLNMPRQPPRNFGGWNLGATPRIVFGRHANSTPANNDATARPSRTERRRQATNQATPNPTAQAAQEEGMFNRFRSRLPSFRPGRSTQSTEAVASGANDAPVTPAQLEAGTRPAN